MITDRISSKPKGTSIEGELNNANCLKKTQSFDALYFGFEKPLKPTTIKLNKNSTMRLAYNTTNSKKTQLNRSKSKEVIGNRLYNDYFNIRNKKAINDKIHNKTFTHQVHHQTKQRRKSKPITNSRNNKDNNNNSNQSPMKSSYETHDTNLVFKPTLNQNSIQIANSMTSTSLTRLLKKKTICNCHRHQPSSTNASTLSLSDYYTYIRNAQTEREYHRKTHSYIPKRVFELYTTKQQDKSHHKQQQQQQQQQQDQQSSSITNKQQSPFQSQSEFYNKNIKWKEQREKSLLINKVKQDKHICVECPFTPDITPLDIRNDEQIIQWNTPSINAYVYKRRSIIKQQQENEAYKKQRFFESSLNYNLQSTSYRNVKVNMYSDLHKKKKNQSTKETCDYINSMRQKLNTKHFFYDYSEEMKANK